ncbi:MAG: hypothetical protein IJX69_06535 [Oscillospiraceae bacterium]|nr:hypothetical protein [Oscillospiraceae bacterium]
MPTNGNALFYGCYDFSDDLLLIEMQVDVSWKWIRWHKFQVPQPGMDPSNWQAPYLEQYLNEAGTERICDLYDTPAENTAPCRFTFFLFKTGAPKLVCPFGEFDLTAPEEVPARLQEVIEFEEDF